MPCRTGFGGVLDRNIDSLHLNEQISKTMKKRTVLLLSAMTAFLAVSAKPGDEISIYGHVTNVNKNNPVKECVVTITNVCSNESKKMSVSSKDGSFLLTGEVCETYLIEAEAAGFEKQSQIVDLSLNKQVEVNIKLAEKKTSNEKLAPVEVKSTQLRNTNHSR
jgi:Carboxypeptidase regulatory-like domain